MSWGLGWKRPTEVFHLTLSYGSVADDFDGVAAISSQSPSAASPRSGSSPTFRGSTADAENNQGRLGFRIDLDWNAGDDEDQVALKLQSQVMVALPTPQDTVEVLLVERAENGKGCLENSGEAEGINLESNGVKEVELGVELRVVKRRDPLRAVKMWRAGGAGQPNDGGMGVLVKLMRSNFANGIANGAAVGSVCAEHWHNVSVVSLCGIGLTVSPLHPKIKR